MIWEYLIREALTKFSLEDTGALSDARMVRTSVLPVTRFLFYVTGMLF